MNISISMAKFKARIWRVGTSAVFTLPKQLLGAEFELGDDCIVTVEPAGLQEQGKNAVMAILSGNPCWCALEG